MVRTNRAVTNVGFVLLLLCYVNCQGNISNQNYSGYGSYNSSNLKFNTSSFGNFNFSNWSNGRPPSASFYPHNNNSNPKYDFGSFGNYSFSNQSSGSFYPKYNSSNPKFDFSNFGKYNFSNGNRPSGSFYPNYNNSNPKYNFSSSFGNNYGKYRTSPYWGNQYPSSGYNYTYNGTQLGHLFLGKIQLYDRLLFNQVYRKESRWWSTREKEIEYPQPLPSGYVRQVTITALRIYNQFLDGNTARATIEKGGVGYPYVKILLKSGWNKGFQYLVQIYGY